MNKNTSTITLSDLVERDGITYFKLNNFPFSGSVKGNQVGTYNRGLKEGLWAYYYKMMGQIERKGTYSKGFRQGIWKTYFKNGQLYSKGTYSDGKKQGLWEYFQP